MHLPRRRRCPLRVSSTLNARVRDAVGLLEPALMREAGIELRLDLDEGDVVPDRTPAACVRC